MNASLQSRERYLPDRGVHGSFVPAAIGLLLCAVGVGWFLNRLHLWGWYFIFIVPLLVALVLAGLTVLVVGQTHCRRPVLAFCLGLSAGLVGYLGHYHFGLMQFLPPTMWHRVDVLPQYIHLRMLTDVQKDAGAPADDDQPARDPSTTDAVFNYIMFLMELGIMAFVPAIAGYSRARRPYCLDLNRWMDREQLPINPGIRADVAAALESGDAEKLLRTLAATRNDQSTCRCILDYVNDLRVSPLEYPVYLTVNDAAPNPSLSRLGRRTATQVQLVKLTVQEVLTLRPVFPGLTQTLANQHEELRDVPGVHDVLEAERDADADRTVGASGSEVAQIAAVPAPFGGTVLTTSHKWIVNGISLLPLAGFFGAFGLGYLGFTSAENGNVVLAVPLFALAAVGFTSGILFAFWYALLPECLYGRSRLRAAIRLRPDALVDADDASAISIGITPREGWQKIQLEIAGDLGLLKVDNKSDTILIEGDHNRYRIPRGSIVSCGPERFFHPMDKKTEHWLVRLVVRTIDGSREILFGASHVDFKPRSNKIRKRIATELAQSIDGSLSPNVAMPHLPGGVPWLELEE